MAEITVYRATAGAGGTFVGEVYSFAPLEDAQYNRLVPSGQNYGIMAESLLIRDNTELLVTFPDELFVRLGPGGRPAVRPSADAENSFFSAWGLAQKAIAGEPGFGMQEKPGDSSHSAGHETAR